MKLEDLSPHDKSIIARAKRDKAFEKRVKTRIAEMFHLPTAEHVDVEKALLYLNYRKSDQHKLDRFLDSINDPKAASLDNNGEINA